MRKMSFLLDEEGIFTAKRLATVLTILLIGVLIVTSSLVSVKAGTIQILLQGGKPIQVYEPGWHFKIPFLQGLETMDMTIQKVESAESTGTNDLQAVSTTVALNYRVNPDAVIDVYNDFHHDYAIRVIKPAIEESLKATTAHFTAEELITRREEVKRGLDEVLSERIENIEGTQYFIFVQVSLTDFAFNPTFQDTIEAKVEQEQKTLEAQNYLEQVQFEAQQKVVQAEAQKEADIATAEGTAIAHLLEENATAMGEMLRADSKAYAIEIVSIAMQENPDYTVLAWIEAWDGKLPATVFGDENIELLLQGAFPEG